VLTLFIFVVVEKRLVEEVRKNDVLIIVGETGSGKTTRRLHLSCQVLITVFLISFVFRINGFRVVDFTMLCCSV